MDPVDVTESSNPNNPFGEVFDTTKTENSHSTFASVGAEETNSATQQDNTFSLDTDTETKDESKLRVVYGSNLTITVDDPKEEGNKLSSYTSYCVTVRPALPGVSYVRRRFSDFEWLRDALVTSFPGVFIPPLPPKKLLGKDQEFIKERTHNLERFMNRLAAIPFCASSETFQNFLSRHESSFDATKKEMDKKLKGTPSPDFARQYNELFPQAFNSPLPDDAEEAILRLRSFLDKSELELTQMVKSCDALVTKSDEVAKEAIAIHTSTIKMEKVEADYAQRPPPARINVLPHFERWSQTLKLSTGMYKSHLADAYRYELEDVQAFIEVLKIRDDIKSKSDKAHVRAEKWRLPGVVATAKQSAQKDDDFAQEESTKFVSDVVTKVILLDQLEHVWKEKTATFRSTIRALAHDYLETAKVITATWENLAQSSEDL